MVNNLVGDLILTVNSSQLSVLKCAYSLRPFLAHTSRDCHMTRAHGANAQAADSFHYSRCYSYLEKVDDFGLDFRKVSRLILSQKMLI